MDDGTATAHAAQHDEVVEIPMQDGGRAESWQCVDVGAQRTGRESELPREIHQAPQRGASERHREPLSHAVQVDVVTEVARDHDQAGERALRSFGCPHDRQTGPAG